MFIATQFLLARKLKQAKLHQLINIKVEMKHSIYSLFTVVVFCKATANTELPNTKPLFLGK